MKIILSGVETKNKGAELMLYAILQEIERKFPEADVYISATRVRQGLDYIKTSLNFHFPPYATLIKKSHVNAILRRLVRRQIDGTEFIKADYFLDGSGFLFSDQTKLWGYLPEYWEHHLGRMYKDGTKIIFLPQAFGPIKENVTQKAIKVLNKYATVIMPREQVSYNYLKDSGLVDMSKVKLFTDFTSLVEGEFPRTYEHLKNGICIIPNVRMLDKGGGSFEGYKNLLSSISIKCKETGHFVYLLNHEGKEDEQLAQRLKSEMSEDIEVVTGLNALEVKGLIASAYALISSRFHGVASALNSCIPCLATSWSHKYQELFNDYGLSDCLLPLDNIDLAIEKVGVFLSEQKNAELRELLNKNVPKIKEETKQMLKLVWEI